MRRTALLALVAALISLLDFKSITAASRPATDSRVTSAQEMQITVSRGQTKVGRETALTSASKPGASGLQSTDSRGALIAQTWRDWQGEAGTRRMVAINPVSPGASAGVHFTHMTRATASGYDRWSYACFDPLSNSFPFPGGTVIVQDNGLSSTEAGYYPSLIVDPDGGKAIVAGFDYPDMISSPTVAQLHVSYDWGPMYGNFGPIVDGSVMSEATENQGNIEAGENVLWPALDITVTSSDTVFYLAALEDISGYDGAVKVFRKVGKATANPDNSWTLVFLDTSWYPTCDVSCDPTSSQVAIAWTKFTPQGRATLNTNDCDIWYASSPTGMSGTWTRLNLTNYTPSSIYRAWMELSTLFDSQGRFHIVWNASITDGAIFGNRQCRLFHWSQQNPGSVRTIYRAEWNPAAVGCAGGDNVMNIGKFSLAECDNRLYVVFSSFADPAYGWTDDCCSGGPRSHAANGEVFLTVSRDMQGDVWDLPRNISDSYTPGCDSAGFGGICADDRYSSLSRFGMRDADYFGSENWYNAVTYDPSGGAYTGDRYLQLFYLTDRFPGGAAAVSSKGPATLNDLRWVRLACVPPVIRASLAVIPSEITFPEFTKPSTPKTYTLTLENIGNTMLTFTSVTKYEDSTKGPGAGPSGWLSFSGAPAAIPEVSSATMYLTLNYGGVITAGPTVLYGKLRFAFTPPANTLELPIQFTVADTIVSATWDTVSTACLDLTCATNGNMGNAGIGRVNMDYAGTVQECDAGDNSRGNASVYLRDGSPVIIRKPTPSTYRASWSIFNDGFNSSYGFKPMTGPGYAPHGSFSTSSYDGFNSGTFLTTDSLVKVEKTWWAPKNADSCNFIVQRMRVFSATINSAVSSLQIGEALDFDVPSDSGVADNVAGIDVTRRMIWIRGFNNTDTVTDCTDNSRRYAGVALLNWHMKDKSCYDSLYAAQAIPNDVYAYWDGGFVPDSISRVMHVAGYSVETRVTDLTALFTFCDGPTGYTLPANDTLTIYTAMATVRTASNTNAGLDSLKRAIDKAKEFAKRTLGMCVIPDFVAPAAIANLQAGSSGQNSIVLTWTAPGDDSLSGRATTYDIRYSTSPTFPADWSTATRVSGEPSPATAGTSEMFTVTGLSAHTTYYFGIRTADEVPNWSPISNVGSASTTAPVKGYWRFNEGSGNTAADASGNNNHGQLINAPTWIAGHDGSAVSLDGINDFVEVDDAASLDIPGPFTITAWVYPKAFPPTNMSIVNKPTNYALQTDAAQFGRLRVAFEDAGGLWRSIESPDSSLALNSWQHVAGVWDGSNLRLFVNGAQVAEGNFGAVTPRTSANPLRIGAQDASSEFFKGYIDELKVYGAGLYDTEIRAEWDGHCCSGTTGNVNMAGIVDLADLSALVSYLTGGGYVLPCQPEANVNAASIVDLTDLSALVSYLTGGGYMLPNCP